MASISKEPDGRRTIQFVGADRKRRSIRLGKISQRSAEAVKVKVERLVFASITGHAADDETARWVAGIDVVMHDKLAAVGLLPRREHEKQSTVSLGTFLQGFVAKRTDVKQQTRETWVAVIRNLQEHFGPERDIATITAGDADGFKLFLIGEKLAPTTIHKRLQHVRMFFKSAKRHKLIDENPFADVRHAAAVDESRKCFVSRDDIDRVLAVCPPTWRMIVALSRFGGLRCPSEVLSLKWQQVDFAAGKMIVPSCKTEHHPGGASRVVPIFATLRPFLEEAFELAADGTEYVVDASYRQAALTPKGWASANLRTQLERLLRRAGVQPWPRLFHAMRASCETELVREHPLHVVAAWLGNTPKVAIEHYLRVTENDFSKAGGFAIQSGAVGGAVSGAVAVHFPVQHPAAQNRKESQGWPQDEDSQELMPVGAAGCEAVRECQEEKNWGTRIRT